MLVRTEEPAGEPITGRLTAALVLAAGQAERLQAVTGGDSKAALRLGGLSLVERAVRGLLAAGLERVVVVTGHQGALVAELATRAGPGRVELIDAEGWRAGNGASLAAAEASLRHQPLFLVVMVDHLFSAGALRPLLAAARPAALLDPAPARAAVAEATKVVVSEGAALAFGKSIDSTWVDCGAFVLPPSIFTRQREAAAEGDQGLAGAISRLAAVSPLEAVPIADGEWWQDVDTPADLATARRRLRRSLHKPADGPVARHLNRPISTRVSMALAPLRPPPDLVTTLLACLSLAAAGLLAAGQGLAGALLVQALSVLDGVDGELARLQLRARPMGALLDGLLDRWSDTAIVAGLGLWALRSGDPGAAVVILAAAAAAGSVLSMASKDRVAALGLASPSERRLGWLGGGHDSRMLMIAVCALVGRPELALAVIAITSGLAVLFRAVTVWRAATPSQPPAIGWVPAPLDVPSPLEGEG